MAGTRQLFAEIRGLTKPPFRVCAPRREPKPTPNFTVQTPTTPCVCTVCFGFSRSLRRGEGREGVLVENTVLAGKTCSWSNLPFAAFVPSHPSRETEKAQKAVEPYRSDTYRTLLFRRAHRVRRLNFSLCLARFNPVKCPPQCAFARAL